MKKKNFKRFLKHNNAVKNNNAAWGRAQCRSAPCPAGMSAPCPAGPGSWVLSTTTEEEELKYSFTSKLSKEQQLCSLKNSC